MSFELLGLFVQYGYWILFFGILLDNAGLPLPGELLLLTFGVLARTGHVDLGIGILVASMAAISGDNAGYWLGRLGGDRLLHTYCRLTLGSGKCLQKAVAFYQVRGRVAVVFGRFVVGVRAFLFPLAGSARLPYAQFLLFDGIGALVWAGLFILVGYAVGWQVREMYDNYRAAAMLLAGILGAAFGAYLLMKLYRRRLHGPVSFHERMVGRVAKALRPRFGATCPARIPTPSEIVLASRNGTGQSDRPFLPRDERDAAEAAPTLHQSTSGSSTRREDD